MEAPGAFERFREDIQTELQATLNRRTSPMYDMLRYHMGWIDDRGKPQDGHSGKALRPTLCLLACDAAGGDYRRSLPAAAAIELVHNFSLIHDDIQDDDLERRHRPTVWALWGKPQAINAGTTMRVLASLSMLRLAEMGIQPGRLLQAQELLEESCLRLIEGQYLDISYESRMDVIVDDYLAMIEGKTAALIACSVEMGAMLATDDQDLVRAFRRFGLNLGLAFQIRDDILGIWGDESKTGKPIGNDIRRRKKSLPIVYALEKAGGDDKARLAEIYEGRAIDDAGVTTVLRILNRVQAKAESEALCSRQEDLALAELDRMHLPSQARHSLEEVATFLAKRDY